MAELAIAPESVRAPDVLGLLAEHARLMQASSPPGSCHFLDPEGLRGPAITFWTAREDGVLLGCGALKELGDGQGELKSMHTAARVRGRGIAAALLAEIVAEAQRRGYRRLCLETGSQDAFEPARRFYRRAGFSVCSPFGEYVEDPSSVFMSRALDAC